MCISELSWLPALDTALYSTIIKVRRRSRYFYTYQYIYNIYLKNHIIGYSRCNWTFARFTYDENEFMQNSHLQKNFEYELMQMIPF